MANWQHKKKGKNERTDDPTNDQFFSNETVGNLSNALIREGIQNNLDETKDKTQPVSVKIFLSGSKYALPSKQFRHYVTALMPHLKAERNGIMPSDLPDFDRPVPYMVFEDFNTKGLEGDPMEYAIQKTRNKDVPHNFFFFWRAYGISGKTGGKMGSWGVGKSVFPASSGINSYFAVTTRDSDKKSYLIGQSVLKTHDLKEDPAECGYDPYGYYANYQDDGFAVPEDSIDEIKNFSSLFRLKRGIGGNQESLALNTGLSIVIPYPKQDINLNNLLYAIIQQFFYPILLGKLEVELQGEDTVYHLKKGTIMRELDKIDFLGLPGSDEGTKENLISLFTFTEWIISRKESDFNKLAFTNVDRAFEWRKDELFKNINLDDLRRQFDAGNPIAFNIPIKFKPEGQNAELRNFNAFIQKDSKLAEPENYFIREYLNIIGVKSLKKKGVRGVVVLVDKDLVTFFGQAEGPAHTGWHKANFRSKYENVEECISFVQRSLERLYAYLLMPSTGQDKNLLVDFFYAPDASEETPKGGASNRGKKKTSKKMEIPSRRPKQFQVDQIKGGFKVTGNPQCELAPESLSIRVAYHRADSNPFSKYSEFDFELKRLTIESKLIRQTKLDKNMILVEPEDRDFEVKVTGFDEKRDLIVDVN